MKLFRLFLVTAIVICGCVGPARNTSRQDPIQSPITISATQPSTFDVEQVQENQSNQGQVAIGTGVSTDVGHSTFTFNGDGHLLAGLVLAITLIAAAAYVWSKKQNKQKV